MNILFNFLTAGVLCVAILGLGSCSEANGPEIPQRGGTPEIPAETFFLVSSVRHGAYDNALSTFTYNEDGIMTTGVAFDFGTFNFTFSPLVLEIDGNDGDMRDEYTYDQVSMNEKGYITYARTKNIYTDDGVERIVKGDLQATYEGDYLTRLVCCETENDHQYVYDTCLEWKEGKLMRVVHKSMEGEEDANITTYEYTYDDAKENSGIYLDVMMNDNPECLFYAGYMGNTTSVIPASVEITYQFGGVSSVPIDVVYDEKGRIVEYKEHGNTSCVYAYDGKIAVWPSSDKLR